VGSGGRRDVSLLSALLGVHDGHRTGALRYRVGQGPFLDDDTELASPPWTSLRALEQASLLLEEKGSEKDPNYDKWLKMLIAPGRSLGGARPKASVLDPKKRLWIAKFPSRSDDTDVGAWEGVAHALAKRAGVTIAEAQVRRFGSAHHTFLTRRFDRADGGHRIHFASAMTMLERRDGEERASYLDLAEVLMTQGAHAARDLEQLWRRIVFTMCVSNVDDHLRNHGFLLEQAGGWSLAPAYDVNPVAHGDGLTLNVSETDNAQDLSLARHVARHFRVKAPRADAIIRQVRDAVSSWRDEATRAGIARSEQEHMAPAFRLADGK
jgi:serine/threonine-protein kinase HipA